MRIDIYSSGILLVQTNRMLPLYISIYNACIFFQTQKMDDNNPFLLAEWKKKFIFNEKIIKNFIIEKNNDEEKEFL